MQNASSFDENINKTTNSKSNQLKPMSTKEKTNSDKKFGSNLNFEEKNEIMKILRQEKCVN